MGLELQAELTCALSFLGAEGPVHARVHEARKSIRRARSILALAADTLDVETEDLALQQVGESLSMLRDLKAATDTAAQLVSQDPSLPWERVVSALQTRTGTFCEKMIAEDPGFKKRRSAIRRTMRAVALLDWTEFKPANLKAGLKRQEARTQEAARGAKREPTADNLHSWRRRARRLRMQVDMLGKLKIKQPAPAMQRPRSLHKLSDALGHMQDLSVLADEIRSIPRLTHTSKFLSQLVHLQAEYRHAYTGIAP